LHFLRSKKFLFIKAPPKRDHRTQRGNPTGGRKAQLKKTSLLKPPQKGITERREVIPQGGGKHSSKKLLY
jgi:hypothetical protein